jgi:hypothetical protein
MAHQAHALPWNSLASHFKYNISYHSHPQRLDIHPQKKQNQGKDLAYFCKAFAKQIHDFGETERAKYQPVEYYRKRAGAWVKFKDKATENDKNASEMRVKSRGKSKETIEIRKVIPTALLQRYDPSVFLLHRDHLGQAVEDWLLPEGEETASYGAWMQGGEIIKVLMMEAASVPPALSAEPNNAEGKNLKSESMETLLLMANHPRMKIHGLRNMHHGHHFGVSRVAEEAVKAYIYLNLIIAMREGGSDVCDFVDDGAVVKDYEKRRKYMDCETYRRMLMAVAGSYDGDAQTLVHRVFFLGNSTQSFGWRDVPTNDVLANLDVAREYLKGVWRVMITYDVVIRETGGDPMWEEECEMVFQSILGVRYEVEY